MNHAEFNIILKQRIEKIKSVLESKAAEYSMNDNRLHNFEVAGRINNESQENAIWGMATKHLVSIIDMVENPESANLDLVNEKIGDMINYLILLESAFIERIELNRSGFAQ